MVILVLYPAIVRAVCLSSFLHCLAKSICLALEKKKMVLIFDGCTQFVALAGITESLHSVLQKNIRGDILKLIAKNSALVKAHNKKLRIDMIFSGCIFFGH